MQWAAAMAKEASTLGNCPGSAPMSQTGTAGFFPICLSGTGVGPEPRARVMRSFLDSQEPRDHGDRLGLFTLTDELDPDDPERWAKGMEAIGERAAGLGREAVGNPQVLDEILPEMLRRPHGQAATLGGGLVQGTNDARGLWGRILAEITRAGAEVRNLSPAFGTLKELNEPDLGLAQSLLDKAFGDPATLRFIPCWQAALPEDAGAAERLARAMDLSGDDLPSGFDVVLWRPEFDALTSGDQARLAQNALATPQAHRVPLNALSMRAHRDRGLGRSADAEMPRVGLASPPG